MPPKRASSSLETAPTGSALQYPGATPIPNIRKRGPPPYFVWTHGGGNVMETPMNEQFAIGFSRVSSIVGFDRGGGGSGSAMFATILKNEPDITSIGGRSAGSVAAVTAVNGSRGAQVENLVIISYPFRGPNKTQIPNPVRVGDYENGAGEDLMRIPRRVNVLFILGDEDSYARLDADGKSLDNTYGWLDGAMPNHKVWRIMLRHASHGSSVPAEHGGEAARDAILQVAGQVTAGWLCGESKSDQGNREGCVWYDVNSGSACWSGWHQEFRLATAAKMKI